MSLRLIIVSVVPRFSYVVRRGFAVLWFSEEENGRETNRKTEKASPQLFRRNGHHTDQLSGEFSSHEQEQFRRESIMKATVVA